MAEDQWKKWELPESPLEHIAVLDCSGRIIAVNPAWERFALENGADVAKTGVGVNYFRMCKVHPGMPWADPENAVAAIKDVMAGRLMGFSCEYACHSPGKKRWFLMQVRPLPKQQAIMVSHIDITNRRRGKKRACTVKGGNDLLEAIPKAVFLCGLDGKLIRVNRAFARMFDLAFKEIEGCNPEEIPSKAIRGIISAQNKETMADGGTRTFEFTTATARGLQSFLVTKGLYHDGKGRSLGVLGTVRDISERRRAEQEIINTSDREKERLGRELRENFCQHLVGILLLGNVLYEELTRAGLEQAGFARQITTLVKEVVSEVRTLEKGLSVTHIEQGEGLVEALKDLAEQARATGHIDCVFHGPLRRISLEPQIAMYLFRIAQEAVHNTLSHAHARRLHIQLCNKRAAVVLAIRDDGVGFSQETPSPLTLHSPIGFPIMYYRSRAIGAKLEIKHLRRGGINLVCTVPKYKAQRGRKSAVRHRDSEKIIKN